jgi:hypothetical protein
MSARLGVRENGGRLRPLQVLELLEVQRGEHAAHRVVLRPTGQRGPPPRAARASEASPSAAGSRVCGGAPDQVLTPRDGVPQNKPRDPNLKMSPEPEKMSPRKI